MAEIVKTPNQVRVYLDESRKMDSYFDASFRNGIWSVTAVADNEVGRVFVRDTQIMREFFEAGLEAVKKAEEAG